MKKLLLISAAVTALMASCSTPKNITYFQDTEQADGAEIVQRTEIRLQPGDQVSVIVNTQSPKLTELFNLPYVTHRLGQNADITVSGTSTGSGQMSGYTIDSDGNIDFPVLGKLHAAGLTKAELSTLVKNELKDQGQANDAVVTVEFMNLSYKVIGEVNRPGRYAISKDGMTVLDAIAAAGDLSIQGNRENITLLRNENGIQKTYELDLLSTRSLIYSPAYYLRQDDVIYVEPNDFRKRQTNVNGNNVRSASFWLSLGSFVTSTILVVQRISKYI